MLEVGQTIFKALEIASNAKILRAKHHVARKAILKFLTHCVRRCKHQPYFEPTSPSRWVRCAVHCTEYFLIPIVPEDREKNPKKYIYWTRDALQTKDRVCKSNEILYKYLHFASEWIESSQKIEITSVWRFSAFKWAFCCVLHCAKTRPSLVVSPCFYRLE